MSISLKNSWVVISIGNREYAINQAYVTSIAQINPHNLIKDFNLKYIKGTYSVLGRSLVIIDGHSIACEKTKYETVKSYIDDITNIKIHYTKLLSDVNNMIIDSNDIVDFDNAKIKFNADIDSLGDMSDEYITRLLKDIKRYGNIYIDFLKNVMIEEASTSTLLRTMKQVENAQKSVDKRVFGNIDKIIEAVNAKICEICLVITIKNKQFGLSADSIVEIVDTFEIRSSKLSNVSSGSLLNKKTGKVYNIIDLTRVAKVIRD